MHTKHPASYLKLYHIVNQGLQKTKRENVQVLSKAVLKKCTIIILSYWPKQFTWPSLGSVYSGTPQWQGQIEAFTSTATIILQEIPFALFPAFLSL